MRRSLIAAIGLGLVAALAQPARAAVPEEHNPGVTPNVVLILLDDARVDDMSTMPDVQARIGDQGATFQHFYSSFPLCCPARATLLTGQYPHNPGVLGNHAPTGGFHEFNDGSTLATWLDPTYRTGLIGKYFNEYAAPYQPPGWNEWMVPESMYGYRSPSWYVDQGSGGEYVSYPGYQTNAIGSLAADFITRNAPSPEPFFLYTSIVAPHGGKPREADDPTGIGTPAVASQYRDLFAGLASTDPSFNEADVSDKPIQRPPLTEAEIAGLTEANAQRREAGLSTQDATNVILDALQASGELDNTYVVFMSDNGYLLGEHRIRIGKIAPYEVATRVLMMVRGPGIAAGTVIEDLAAQVDFAPTVLSMTHTVSPDPTVIDGIDLLPKMLDPALPLTREAVVIEATQIRSPSDPLPWLYHGVLDGRWKYVERESGRKELYDLASDPYELQNVAGDMAYAETEARLASLLITYKWCKGLECQ